MNQSVGWCWGLLFLPVYFLITGTLSRGLKECLNLTCKECEGDSLRRTEERFWSKSPCREPHCGLLLSHSDALSSCFLPQGKQTLIGGAPAPAPWERDEPGQERDSSHVLGSSGWPQPGADLDHAHGIDFSLLLSISSLYTGVMVASNRSGNTKEQPHKVRHCHGGEPTSCDPDLFPHVCVGGELGEESPEPWNCAEGQLSL